jgi:hypothetical protein
MRPKILLEVAKAFLLSLLVLWCACNGTKVMRAHKIPEKKFNRILQSGTTTTKAVPCQLVLEEQMQHFIGNSTYQFVCITNNFEFTLFDDQNFSSVKYPAQLFKDILNTKPQEFRFFYVSANPENNNKPDLIFQVIYTNGSPQYYDLSQPPANPAQCQGQPLGQPCN